MYFFFNENWLNPSLGKHTDSQSKIDQMYVYMCL